MDQFGHRPPWVEPVRFGMNEGKDSLDARQLGFK